MGKVRLKVGSKAEGHFISAVLGAELQDIMMTYAEKYEYDTSILITEQIADKEANTLEMVMTGFGRDWDEGKWVKQKKQEHEILPLKKTIKENFHNYYWSLSVCGVTINNGLRYKAFEDAYNEAIYWEKVSEEK